MTKLTYNGEVVFTLTTNKSMTLDEVIEFAGYERNQNQSSPDDGDFVDENGNEYFYDDFNVED